MNIKVALGLLLVPVMIKTAQGVFGNMCHCKAYGDPHYETCDGAKLSYQGACAYNLVSTCTHGSKDDRFISFQILIKNRHPVSNAQLAYARAVKITFGKRTVYLDTKGLVKLDGVQVHDNQLPLKNKRIMLSKSAHGDVEHVAMTTDVGFNVTLDIKEMKDQMGRVDVQLPPWYKNAGLCGLCGNWNGDANDDYTMKDGVNVADLDHHIRDALVSDSFHTHDPELDRDECEETLANSPIASHLRTKQCNEEQLVRAQKMCGFDQKVLKKSFKKCLPVLNEEGMNVDGYGNACINAFCTSIHNGMDTARLGSCTVIKSLSDQCNEHGVKAKRKWIKKNKCYAYY